MGRPFPRSRSRPESRRSAPKALRKALDLAKKDREFLAEAEERSLEINPVSGHDLEKLITELYQTPKDVVAEAHEAIERSH